MAPTLRKEQILQKPKSRKNKFTNFEDQQILSLVGADENSTNWELVAMALGTRTARQCKDRFHMYLAPGLNKADWLPEEDNLLIDLVSKYGQKWKAFAPYFTGRPEISLKNRFRLLQRRNRHLIVGNHPFPIQQPQQKQNLHATIIQQPVQQEPKHEPINQHADAVPEFDFFKNLDEQNFFEFFDSFSFEGSSHPFL